MNLTWCFIQFLHPLLSYSIQLPTFRNLQLLRQSHHCFCYACFTVFHSTFGSLLRGSLYKTTGVLFSLPKNSVFYLYLFNPDKMTWVFSSVDPASRTYPRTYLWMKYYDQKNKKLLCQNKTNKQEGRQQEPNTVTACLRGKQYAVSWSEM